MIKQKNNLTALLPVMAGFFIMAFVDLVGLASNYVKQDFTMNDTVANLISIACYIWFLVFPVPTAMMMNRFGRRKVVIAGYIITAAALLIPLIAPKSFAAVLVAFALIGIGNTVLQVAMNPLVQQVVSPDKLTGSLTIGQFVKAAASLLGPILFPAFAGATLGWRTTFLVYSILCILASVWLGAVKIKEEGNGASLSFGGTFKLFKDRTIFVFFLGILALVGADVGMAFTLPRVLQERFVLSLDDASRYLTIYYLSKTVAAFAGGILLMKVKEDRFYFISGLIALAGLALMVFAPALALEIAGLIIFGVGMANLFSILFSLSLKHRSESANEVSALLIMGVAGGGVVTPVLGILTDAFQTQTAALISIMAVWVFTLAISPLVKKTAHE